MENRIKEKEIKIIFLFVAALFAVFLLIPIARLFIKSFEFEGSIGLGNYIEVLTGRGFITAFGHSIAISSASAVVTTVLAFILTYTIHYSGIPKTYKLLIRRLAVLPMLLPTITYGFAIIYSFGKQGLITQILGRQLFDIYGFNGLQIGRAHV